MTEKERIESIKINGGQHLKNFKRTNITYDMCMAAVKNDGSALQYVPEELRDQAIYKEACRSYGLALADVPKDMATEEMYTLAVKSNGAALAYIPQSKITSELCRYAALSTPAAFNYVPEEYITPELVLESLRAQSKPKWDYSKSENVMTSGLESFKYIPAELKTTEMCLALVALEPELIWEFPKKNRTAKVCSAAIKAFGYDSVEEAIKDNPRLLTRMHESLCTESVSLAFVNSDYFTDAVRFNRDPDSGEKRGMKATLGGGNFFLNGDEFPLKNILKHYSVATIATKKCWDMLMYVPKKIVDYELCKAAVESDVYSFMYVPQKYRTKELCDMAFQKSPDFAISYIPEELITDDMCYKVIEESPLCLMSIPDSKKTKEICLRAVQKYPSQMMYVPKDLQEDIKKELNQTNA